MKGIAFLTAALTATSVLAQSSDSIAHIASTLLTRRYVKYPVAAEDAGIEGTVWVEFTIDRLCNIRYKRVVRGLGYGLDEAALKLIDKKYEDALTTALAPCVADTLVVPVRFHLR